MRQLGMPLRWKELLVQQDGWSGEHALYLHTSEKGEREERRWEEGGKTRGRVLLSRAEQEKQW